MQLATAIDLIKPAIRKERPQLFVDLGAGSGLFTQALASLIGSGKIIAVDMDKKSMSSIALTIGGVQIEKVVSDFNEFKFDNLNADGILMANALHFVRDKISILAQLKKGLKSGGILVIVEYEMTKPNPWVPWPISFEQLTKVVRESGFESVTKIGTTESRYQKQGIYAALADLETPQ